MASELLSLPDGRDVPTAMPLPFTREQFFDLFGAYNRAFWPVVVALWIASLLVARRLSTRRPHDRWIAAVLAAHWIWSGLAYHLLFFTRINQAAWGFAALFLAQAVVVYRAGVVQRRLSFSPWSDRWAPLAWGLIAYSLAYPVINAIDHRSLVRIPAFGVPCPTAIFSAGVLMLATPRSWSLALIPVAWSGIAGSAALLLGVHADLALPVAGMALAMFTSRRATPGQRRAGSSPADRRSSGGRHAVHPYFTGNCIHRRSRLRADPGIGSRTL